MKPTWDQLADEFKNSKHSGVYDVDCTADGKDLCEKVGVKGYPTIKYGDASNLEGLSDYDGGRDFESLKKFAEEKLGPICGPKSLDACDNQEKALVEAAMAKSLADLESEIATLDKDLSAKQKKFTKKRRIFDEKYNDFQEELKDHNSDKRSHAKAKTKLEQNAKATKADQDKFAKQDKKINELIAKFQTREDEMGMGKIWWDNEQAELDAEVKASGLKLMKVVRLSKTKDEL